ncbi:hypothetical protein H5410_055969 [Solanum commersonii]|uniref:Uncharacterized protein n=1 Tax=Solanum commersonii TaxID=4109 RepID=A0A9J5WJ00_SOLCO|nr:hypothetical protein H5410_055969 [Solanum commersonii]
MRRVVEIPGDTGDEDDDPLSFPICAREISVMHLKNKINLKKQSEVYNERGNALNALYGFPWVWIYEVFSHLGKYAKNSLDSPLPIPRLLRWHTTKSDSIIEGDTFSTRGELQRCNCPHFTVENEEDEILGENNSNQPCENSVSSGQNNKDDNLFDEDYTTPTVDKDGVAVDVDEILPLAIVNEDLVAVDEYFAEEVNE